MVKRGKPLLWYKDDMVGFARRHGRDKGLYAILGESPGSYVRIRSERLDPRIDGILLLLGSVKTYSVLCR